MNELERLLLAAKNVEDRTAVEMAVAVDLGQEDLDLEAFAATLTSAEQDLEGDALKELTAMTTDLTYEQVDAGIQAAEAAVQKAEEMEAELDGVEADQYTVFADTMFTQRIENEFGTYLGSYYKDALGIEAKEGEEEPPKEEPKGGDEGKSKAKGTLQKIKKFLMKQLARLKAVAKSVLTRWGTASGRAAGALKSAIGKLEGKLKESGGKMNIDTGAEVMPKGGANWIGNSAGKFKMNDIQTMIAGHAKLPPGGQVSKMTTKFGKELEAAAKADMRLDDASKMVMRQSKEVAGLFKIKGSIDGDLSQGKARLEMMMPGGQECNVGITDKLRVSYSKDWKTSPKGEVEAIKALSAKDCSKMLAMAGQIVDMVEKQSGGFTDAIKVVDRDMAASFSKWLEKNANDFGTSAAARIVGGAQMTISEWTTLRYDIDVVMLNMAKEMVQLSAMSMKKTKSSGDNK